MQCDWTWNWGSIPDWLVAIGTILVAVAAIWGDRLKERWFGPRLTIHLLSPRGELVPVTVPGATTSGRFYHLRVMNMRRASPAKNVRVVLTRVARAAPNGELQWEMLSGPIQFQWQHGHSSAPVPDGRPPLNADLGNVLANGMFTVTTMFCPNNLSLIVQRGQRMAVEAIAVSDSTESKPVCIEISWDGLWADDGEAMGRHLVVREIEAPNR